MRLAVIIIIYLLVLSCARGKVNDLASAEELYYERCSTCHSATNPNRYNATEWLGILESMQVHSGLDKNEFDIIYKYLSESSKKTK